MQNINHPTTHDAGSSPCTPEAHQRSAGATEREIADDIRMRLMRDGEDAYVSFLHFEILRRRGIQEHH